MLIATLGCGQEPPSSVSPLFDEGLEIDPSPGQGGIECGPQPGNPDFAQSFALIGFGLSVCPAAFAGQTSTWQYQYTPAVATADNVYATYAIYYFTTGLVTAERDTVSERYQTPPPLPLVASNPFQLTFTPGLIGVKFRSFATDGINCGQYETPSACWDAALTATAYHDEVRYCIVDTQQASVNDFCVVDLIDDKAPDIASPAPLAAPTCGVSGTISLIFCDSGRAWFAQPTLVWTNAETGPDVSTEIWRNTGSGYSLYASVASGLTSWTDPQAVPPCPTTAVWSYRARHRRVMALDGGHFYVRTSESTFLGSAGRTCFA